MDSPTLKKVCRRTKNYLSKDSVVDILSRLPAKSLCRFSCVSKRWRSLILEPFSRKLHRGRSLRSPLFMFYYCFPEEISNHEGGCCCSGCMAFENAGEEDDGVNSEPEPEERQIPIHYLRLEDEKGHLRNKFGIQLDGYGEVSVIPSGRELVCLQRKDLTLYVCNPIGHEWLKLPNPSSSWEKNTDCFSLSFVPSLNHYKLLHLYYTVFDLEDAIPQVAIADVLDIKIGEKPGRWRPACSRRLPYRFKWELMKMVGNVDAAVYWWYIPDWQHRPEYKFESIVCFDLEKEDCFTVKKPQGCQNPFGRFTRLVGLKGCLSLTNFDVVDEDSAKNMVMDIWTLKDPRNSIWEKEYTINNMPSFDDQINFKILPLYFSEREMIFFERCDGSCWSRVRFFDLVTKSTRSIQWLPKEKENKNETETGPFLYFDGFFPLAVADGSTA